jgi:hypothetical protein
MAALLSRGFHFQYLAARPGRPRFLSSSPLPTSLPTIIQIEISRQSPEHK